MAACKSMNRHGEPCGFRAIPSTRYCVFHQESAIWFALILGAVLSGITSFSISVYLQRDPLISVICNNDPSNNLSKILCTVSNSGDADSQHIQLKFSGFLPLDTKIYSDPGTGMKILQDTLPMDPMKYVKSSKIPVWFIVYIPRVSPGEELTFVLQTFDSGNIDVANYLSHKVSHYIQKNIREFYSFLHSCCPDEIKSIDIKEAINVAVQKISLFEPETFHYEKGTHPINYYSTKGEASFTMLSNLTNKYKEKYVEILNNSPNFHQPVIRILTSDGPHSMMSGLPFVRQFISFSSKIPAKEDFQAAKDRGEKTLSVIVEFKMPPEEERIQEKP